MKFDFYHLKSYGFDEPFPILDWVVSYNKAHFQYKNMKFTGKYWKILSISFVIFRHYFNLTWEWDFKVTSPEEAKKRYHAKRLGSSL